MNLERITKKFEDYLNELSERGCDIRDGWNLRAELKKSKQLIKKYLSVPLTLPIEDEPMQRICEVLTRAGYRTFDSCCGHGNSPPTIFMECPSQYHLRHLTDILATRSRENNFPWDLRTFSPDVFLNSENPLSYILSPIFCKNFISPKDYETLVDDLDIIGICTMRYFLQLDRGDLTYLEEKRKQEEKNLKTFGIPNFPDNFFK